MAKITIKIKSDGSSCAGCDHVTDTGSKIVCGIFGTRLVSETGIWFLTRYLRCADCKKAEKAAEKTPC